MLGFWTDLACSIRPEHLKSKHAENRTNVCSDFGVFPISDVQFPAFHCSHFTARICDDLTFSVKDVWIGSVLNEKHNHWQVTLTSGPVEWSRAQLTTNRVQICTLQQNKDKLIYGPLHTRCFFRMCFQVFGFFTVCMYLPWLEVSYLVGNNFFCNMVSNEKWCKNTKIRKHICIVCNGPTELHELRHASRGKGGGDTYVKVKY